MNDKLLNTIWDEIFVGLIIFLMLNAAFASCAFWIWVIAEFEGCK